MNISSNSILAVASAFIPIVMSFCDHGCEDYELDWADTTVEIVNMRKIANTKKNTKYGACHVV